MIVLLKLLGWLLAKAPLLPVQSLARLLGKLAYLFLAERRRILHSNLHHAFPDRPISWHQKMARESCARTMEMGLLVLALPYLSIKQLSRRINIPSSTRKAIDQIRKSDRPTLLLIPHFTLYEYLPMLPGVLGLNKVDAGAIFRPLKNQKLNSWIQKTRERYGLKLLSRRKGITLARQILERGGVLSILFDQNARRSGMLMHFFGRIASTSELPRILAARYSTQTYIFHPRRIRFWHAEAQLVPVGSESSRQLLHEANRWLEKILETDDDCCADWLWMHNRWRIQDSPRERFVLSHRKQDLDFSCLQRGYRLWIRLPNDMENARPLLPLVAALRKGRPDAEITLLCTEALQKAVELLGIADHFKTLPPIEEKDRFKHIYNWRSDYPDTLILLTESTIADAEAKAIAAPQRFGLITPGLERPVLTHAHQSEKDMPLFDSYKQMLRQFGLKEEIPEQIEWHHETNCEQT